MYVIKNTNTLNSKSDLVCIIYLHDYRFKDFAKKSSKTIDARVFENNSDWEFERALQYHTEDIWIIFISSWIVSPYTAREETDYDELREHFPHRCIMFLDGFFRWLMYYVHILYLHEKTAAHGLEWKKKKLPTLHSHRHEDQPSK